MADMMSLAWISLRANAITAHMTAGAIGATGASIGGATSAVSADATKFRGVSGPENTAGVVDSTAAVVDSSATTTELTGVASVV